MVVNESNTDKTSRFRAIIGAAGCGKSHWLMERLKEDPKFCLLTSTTGISAINLQGVTINSALGFFDTESLWNMVVDPRYKKAKKVLIANLLKIRKLYRNLSIDETSFNSRAKTQLLCALINEANNEDIPYPPLGLILTGDPLQLPFIVDKKGYDKDPFFMAHAFKDFEITDLTEVKRQEDKDFIEALSLVRKGKAAEAVQWFADNIDFSPKLNTDYEGMTIIPTNDKVNMYNRKYLQELPGKQPMKYVTVRTKVQRGEWNKHIPDYLLLKRNTEVIILTNNFDEGYANGDRAIVLETLVDSVLVEIGRTGKKVLIKPIVRDNIPVGETKSVGSIKYMPLKVGKYSTIHMCQGLTVDSLQVRVTDGFLSKLSGGLYVSLSRVRTKEGLRIVGTKEAFVKACFVEQKYLDFIKTLEKEPAYV